MNEKRRRERVAVSYGWVGGLPTLANRNGLGRARARRVRLHVRATGTHDLSQLGVPQHEDAEEKLAVEFIFGVRVVELCFQGFLGGWMRWVGGWVGGWEEKLAVEFVFGVWIV